MKYINIDTNLIPYSFEIELDDELFRFEIYYNERFDYFTIDLYNNDNPVLLGEKITLGVDVFDIVRYKSLILTPIIPRDLSQNATKITFENINKEVYLYVEGDDSATI